MTSSRAATPRQIGQAVRDLSAAQKAGAGVPAYTRYVNRPLGRLAAALAHVVGLTPNQVTVISGVLSFLSITVLVTMQPSLVLGIAVAVGLAAGYVLDSADGQLARLRGGGSPAGEWLDHVVDAARMPALHLGVLIALYRFHGELPSALLLLPIGFLLVTVVRFFALILAEQMRRQSGPPEGVHSSTSDSAARSLLALPGDFGVLCLIFIGWGSSSLFLVCYGILFVLNTLLLVLSLVRRYRELDVKAV
ncbi:CDP-alcohol phosphatidyltransferase family protein [Prauserella halophila]|uniref:CDP-alcohol phosphatidyltransferase family protein n=1 Tax=Prauserella halophila TaxID=185641 RepID=A0ABN1WN88_9PSEU|nr:CDP-alcohol phosphatidyltransferase family protein [Prauserella halophila]MCP2236796.1 CDP-alcohol phosphatidyltransferase [Prauserella halophila]